MVDNSQVLIQLLKRSSGGNAMIEGCLLRADYEVPADGGELITCREQARRRGGKLQ